MFNSKLKQFVYLEEKDENPEKDIFSIYRVVVRHEF
jgi:hypothetical protein